MMAETVRTELRKESVNDSPDEFRIRSDVFDGDNKWRRGGCWPRKTVAMNDPWELLTLNRNRPGAICSSGFESSEEELHHPIGDSYIALTEVTNLLVSSSSEKQRQDDYAAAYPEPEEWTIDLFLKICKLRLKLSNNRRLWNTFHAVHPSRSTKAATFEDEREAVAADIRSKLDQLMDLGWPLLEKRMIDGNY